jgi:integrase/recombinase XerD
MNGWRREATDYLAMRRALGFKLRGQDRLLADFLGYLEEVGTTSITAQIALSWATRDAELSPVRWAQRLSVVRGFARHLHGLDPRVEVPAMDLLPCQRRRGVPYLYAESDIGRLLEAAASLRPALRAATYETLLGLVAATGMRLGEAISLDRGDVDLGTGVIEINDAKFRKHRRIPLHHTTVGALRRYETTRDELCPKPKAPSFFVSTRGTRLLDVCVHGVFVGLVQQIGLEAQPGTGRPRIHDLRHGFAMATLRDWYRSGADVAGKLPVLSAYLGHAHPASTYWYLQACPELLGLAAQRLERVGGSSR